MKNKKDKKDIEQNFQERKLILFNLSSVVSMQMTRLLYRLKPLHTLVTSESKQVQDFLSDDENYFFVIDTAQELDEDSKKLLEKINQLPEKTPRPPILLIASKAGKEAFLKSADEKFDSVLFKPFNLEKLKSHVLHSMESSKIRVRFLESVEAAQMLMVKGNYTEAQRRIEETFQFAKRSALSLCLLGELFQHQKNFAKSLDFYCQALELRPRHYRSLKGIASLFKETGFPNEEYKTLKKIFVLYNPESTELKQALRLCIQTENFSDMDVLIDLYLETPHDLELDKYMAAALSVYCIHLIVQEKADKVYYYAHLITKTKLKHGSYLRNIIQKLRDYKHFTEIPRVLKLFPEKEHTTRDYKITLYYYYSATKSEDFAIQYFIQLFEEGIKDPEMIKEVVRKLHKQGNAVLARQIQAEAQTR